MHAVTILFHGLVFLDLAALEWRRTWSYERRIGWHEKMGGMHLPVEGGVRAQIETSQRAYDGATEQMRPHRHPEPGIDMAQIPPERHAPVPGKAPAKPTLPRVARHEAPDPRGHDQRLEHDRAGLVPQRLVEQGQSGNQGGRVEEGVEVGDGEEHGYGKWPGGVEADEDSAHDGDGDHALGSVHFLGEMSRAVEAREGVVGVDETDYVRCGRDQKG